MKHLLLLLPLAAASCYWMPEYRHEATVPQARSWDDVIAPEAPPLPKLEMSEAEPSTRHHWLPGYWDWEHRWTWIDGYWGLPPEAGSVWISGYWIERSEGWRWVRGRWRFEDPPKPLEIKP